MIAAAVYSTENTLVKKQMRVKSDTKQPQWVIELDMGASKGKPMVSLQLVEPLKSTKRKCFNIWRVKEEGVRRLDLSASFSATDAKLEELRNAELKIMSMTHETASICNARQATRNGFGICWGEREQVDLAKQLLCGAKKLRQSSDPVINDKIHINSNSRRAEATAAYQVRVPRRLALQRCNERSNAITRFNGSDTSGRSYSDWPSVFEMATNQSIG